MSQQKINWEKRYKQVLMIQRHWVNKWTKCTDKNKVLYKLNQVGICSELLTQIRIKAKHAKAINGYKPEAMLELRKNKVLLKQQLKDSK